MRPLRKALWVFVWYVFVPAYILYRKAVRRAEWFCLVRHMEERLEVKSRLFDKVATEFFVTEQVCRATDVFCDRWGYTRVESTEERKTLYWEAPLGIAIWAKEGPLVGMAVEFRGDALCIRQMQGVSGAKIPPELKMWPRMFVQACIECVREEPTLREVRVYKADNSLCFLFPEGMTSNQAVLAHQQRMQRRYEGTARQMGFTKKEKWYSWVKPN